LHNQLLVWYLQGIPQLIEIYKQLLFRVHNNLQRHGKKPANNWCDKAPKDLKAQKSLERKLATLR
jgi:hypothetical protein